MGFFLLENDLNYGSPREIVKKSWIKAQAAGKSRALQSQQEAVQELPSAPRSGQFQGCS